MRRAGYAPLGAVSWDRWRTQAPRVGRTAGVAVPCRLVDATPDVRLRAALDALQAAYEVLDCDPELADTAAFLAHYGHAPDTVVNTLLVVAKRGPAAVAACAVLADSRLDVNGAARRALAIPKASFAPPEQTEALTGMELGGVAPFGLPDEVRVLVDARVLDHPRVIVGGGSRRHKLAVDPEVFRRAPRTLVVDGLARFTGA